MKQKWYLKTWLIVVLCSCWFIYGIPLVIGIVLLVLKLQDEKKLYSHVTDLEADLNETKLLLTPEMQDAIAFEKHVRELQDKETTLKSEINSKEKQISDLTQQIKKKEKNLIVLDDEILVQEFGLFKPKYDLCNVEQYKNRLDDVRNRQKQLIKDKAATTGNVNWTVNGSKSQGNKMVSDMQKLLLRAFNSECDEVINKVKYNNFDASLKKITSSKDAISKFGAIMDVSITQKYFKLKVEELQLALEYQLKKQEEKEALKQARAEMREQAKLQKEIEEQRKKVEKEQKHYQQALSSVLTKLQADANDPDLLAKKQELETQLGVIETSLKDIDYRNANQRAGYVYIISNIGSFGENVYKIGMTRRLEPLDRIDELGDASVPFNFDVNAMIFTDDAPGLENALHKAFEDRKLNMVNTRREFFRVTLDEIKEVVRNNYDKTVEFIDVADAEQYRVSMKMKEEQ